MTISEALEDEMIAIPVFQDLSERSRSLLSSGSSVKSYERGTVLFQQGETPAFLFIVLKGTVHLLSRATGGKAVTMACARTGDFILPAAIVTRKPYLLQARCVSRARILRVEAAILHELLERDSILALAFLKRTSEQSRINIDADFSRIE